jgi:hypothetical protein
MSADDEFPMDRRDRRIPDGTLHGSGIPGDSEERGVDWEISFAARAVQTDGPPRRCRLDLLTPLEVAAFELMRAAECAGGHPLLSEIGMIALEAKRKAADWIDGGADGIRHPDFLDPGGWDPLDFDRDYPRPWIPEESAEPEPEPPAEGKKRWRIVSCDGSHVRVSGTQLVRDDDWVIIYDRGEQVGLFHRPQSVIPA